MPHVILGNRNIINFSGPDAAHLMHNVLTCKIETLAKNTAQICALLTPQGKVQFEFFVSKKAEDHFQIEIESEQATAFIQRMTMYRLRSKVEIAESSESLTAISWDSDSMTSSDLLTDTRFKALNVTRHYLSEGQPTDRAAWDALRVEYGIAESGSDFALSDAFPHDISYDQNGGVDFKKGCYIGQEIVSRMHHRNTARRRILIAQSDAPLTQKSQIIAHEKPVGMTGTVSGNQALCLCRIDRVKDAVEAGHDLTADGTSLTLSLPPHVSYDWPKEAKDG